MSYVIEQQIGNHRYFYEVTSYWDAQKKQSRQKRKDLGKKNPATGQRCPPHTGSIPRLAKDYGHVYVLQAVAEQIGLPYILNTVFPEESRTLLALAFFEISEAAPRYLVPYGVASTAVSEVLPLRSRELTTFTQHLGRLEHNRLEFSRQWVKQAGQVQAVAFDITSLSSYAELLAYGEGGYNRDIDPLPPINLGIISAEHTPLPLHYQVYPGSIPEVSTLQTMLHYLELFELPDMIFIADRGFYRAANLAKLQQAARKFILPLPRSVKHFSGLLTHYKQALTNPANAFRYHDEVLLHVHETIELNQVPLEAHLCFREPRKSDQTTRFLSKIPELETAARQEPFHTAHEARHSLARQMTGASHLFQVQKHAGPIGSTRKPQTLARRMGQRGTTLMLSNDQDIPRETIRDLDRRKDYLEKPFAVLKNEFDGKRRRGHSKEAVAGRLFIKFLSLILYAALGNTMRKEQLFKQYRVKERMYELKKLKSVELTTGKSSLTEVSKRQKDLLTKLGINMPSIKT